MRDSLSVSQIRRLGLVVILAGTSMFSVGPSMLAHDGPSYERGVLLSMDSQSCGTTENGGKTIAGEILGTDSEKKTTEQVLCQDYTLQTDRVVYRIRQKDDKHPILLPVGDSVQFRIRKSSMFLRDPETDQKEREYTVISMAPRSDVKDARNDSPPE